MKRYHFIFFTLLFLLFGCSRKPVHPLTMTQSDFLITTEQTHNSLTGDYASNPLAYSFIEYMVQQYGFEREELLYFLSQAQRLDNVLDLMERQAPSRSVSGGPNGAWLRYRKKFITPANIQNGVVFWNQYHSALQQAWQEYGIPPEIIVGIIGVETRWGRVMGKTRILDALATLAFEYPRRANYFKSELEAFLLMVDEEGYDPFSLRGSFAGAMGYGQFMPSSYRKYAVDFNHDGQTDLWDPIDAIGSIANYFKSHGWIKDAPIAVRATGHSSGLKHGFDTRYTVSFLASSGFVPQRSLDTDQEVSLLRLDVGDSYQYWYGLPNFYTLTRYNHSTYYAMAVWQLGEAVRVARGRNE